MTPLLLAGEAQAQANTLRGIVVSEQNRQPLPEVLVTATSPSLRGELSVVTDAQGQYRLLGMPPGVYTLRFEADGFIPFVREDLRLRPNHSLSVNAKLLPRVTGFDLAYSGPYHSWAPGLLEGGRASVPDGRAPRHLGDFGVTLGGTHLESGLRVFAGVTPTLGRVEHPGPSGTSFTDQRGFQALGRLTYELGQDHQVSLSAITAPQSLREEGTTLDRDTTHVAIHQSSRFQDRYLQLDVHAGWLGQRDSREPPSERLPPEDGVLLERALDQYQARARLTWTRPGGSGSHTLKAGSLEPPPHVPCLLPPLDPLRPQRQHAGPLPRWLQLHPSPRAKAQEAHGPEAARRGWWA